MYILLFCKSSSEVEALGKLLDFSLFTAHYAISLEVWHIQVEQVLSVSLEVIGEGH